MPNTPSETAPQATVAPRVLRPDRELLRRVLASGGENIRSCMQCATCSAVCELASEQAPLPRKEMHWLQWGLSDRLMADVDLWLCHECHDCTARCPRRARPGDAMAALRRECVVHFATPRWLARVASQPRGLVGVTLLSSMLLGAAYSFWHRFPLFAFASHAGEARLVIPFCTALPHELLLTLFGLVLVFDIAVLTISLTRFWHALRAFCPAPTETRESLTPVSSVIRHIFWHRDFAQCTDQASRRVSHSIVMTSMLALLLVDAWVIVARFNPLQSGLVYPLGLLAPWKILANLAGAGLVAGSAWMMRERWRRAWQHNSGHARAGTYFDWLLLALLMAVALTGFATEALHLARLDALRVGAYVVHLIAVLALLILLPYSKLAHVGFRSLALFYAQRHLGRTPSVPTGSPS